MKLATQHILHEDNHLLIVNKPAGILSQGDQTGDSSIIDIGKAYIKEAYSKPGAVFLGLPHRLDRPVSGLIILCKTSKALTRMTELFRDRSISKIYHAIVLGKPPADSERLISYLKKDTDRRRALHSPVAKEGYKEAILSYSLIKSMSQLSLLEVTLETGRPHQIRAQLSAIGSPILGDLKYHQQDPLADKSIGLHAREVRFIHPVKKTELKITAPYPSQVWWNKV